MASKKMASVHGSSEKEGKAWGRGEHANMPKEVKMSMYPRSNEAGPMEENDTMTRVDAENKRARMKTRSHLSDQH